MERNRDLRRVSSAAATNGGGGGGGGGLVRRRHRTSSLRDSPEEDGGGIELQESGKLRDRGNNNKKERDRLSRSKRRRGSSNRDEGGEESSEESIDDDDDDDDDEEEDEDEVIRMNTPSSSSMSNHHHHHKIHNNNHHRKSFPPPVMRTAPPWKVSDEMGFQVPKKTPTSCAKMAHDYSNSGGGGGGEMIHRQASTSPARPSATMTASPVSPSSSNARKKMKPIGHKHKPPKISKLSSSSSVQEGIEIEIAEVLFGLMRQPQCPSRQEVVVNSSQKLDTNGSVNDIKSSRVSSPLSISPPLAHQPSPLTQNSSSSATPLVAMPSKRKRPRPMLKSEEEKPVISTVHHDSLSSMTKIKMEQPAKIEVSSLKWEKTQVSSVENGGNLLNLT